jgi:hypothetical protein
VLISCHEEPQHRNQVTIFTSTCANYSLRAALVGELAKLFFFRAAWFSLSPSASLSSDPATTFSCLPTWRVLRQSRDGLRGAGWHRLPEVWKSRHLVSGSLQKFNVEMKGCKAVTCIYDVSTGLAFSHLVQPFRRPSCRDLARSTW